MYKYKFIDSSGAERTIQSDELLSNTEIEEVIQNYGGKRIESGTEAISTRSGETIPVQQEYTETGAIDTRTSQPQKKWTPTGKQDPSFWTEWKASWSHNPAEKVRKYSAARFPDLSDKERAEKYRVGWNDQIYFKGDDGKWYEEGSGTMKQVAADMLGGSLPATLLGIGGTLIGGPGLGFLGAAGGRGYQKAYEGYKNPDDYSRTEAIGSMFIDGLANFIGDRLVGGTGKAVYNKSFLRAKGGPIADIAVKDLVPDFMNSEEGKRLINLAKRYGIDMDSVMMSLPSGGKLSQLYELLGRLPGGEDLIASDRTKVMGQITQGIKDYVRDIAPKAKELDLDPAFVSDKLRKNADEIIKAEERRRTNSVEDLYKEAFRETPPLDISASSQLLDGYIKKSTPNSPGEKVFEKLKSYIHKKQIPGQPLELQDNLEMLDQAKQYMDRMIKDYDKENLTPKDLNRLIEFRRKFRRELELSSQKYELGKAIYEEVSPPIDETIRSVIGKMARSKEGSVEAYKALFENENMTAAHMRYAFNKLYKKDPDAWVEGLRSYLINTFEKRKNTELAVGQNVGSWFQKQVFGSEQQRKVMAAAMGGEHSPTYQRFSDFMKILSRSGLKFTKESRTAGTQETIKEMNLKSIIEGFKDIKQTGGTLLWGIMKATEPIQSVKEGIALLPIKFQRNYRRKLIDAIINPTPGQIKIIKDMKLMSKGSEKLLNTLGAFLGDIALQTNRE